MPHRLLLALIILVAAPLVLLGWMTRTTIASHELTARQGIDDLFQNQLAQHDRIVTTLFDRYQQEFSSAVNAADGDTTALHRLPQEKPVARSVVIVDTKGNVLYPPPSAVTFHRQLVNNRPPISRSPISLAPVVKGDTITVDSAATPTSAWQSWYMDEGMQLVYWNAGPKPLLSLGVLLERSRWISDLTAALPSSSSTQTSNADQSDEADSSSYRSKPQSLSTGFTALVDEQNRIVYRWGDHSDRRTQPIATRFLPAPIANWRLEFHADDPLPATSFLPTLLSLGGVGVLLVALGGYVLSSVRRRMREAQSRVSFASQVSHELRTPLTNIRLYAELAESDVQRLTDGDPKTSIQKRLAVIDNESRRLGRLVSGVLEIIRGSNEVRPPRVQPICPDEVIDQSIGQFEPSFQAAGIVVDRHRAASQAMLIDSDLLEMILVNLLGNVLKYAASGKQVRIDSECTPDELIVDIADQGPGIPPRQRRRVFEPFTRLDDSISAPSGTGIGLAIARKMAERHGGSLNLVPSPQGAHFQLRIAAEWAQKDTS